MAIQCSRAATTRNQDFNATELCNLWRRKKKKKVQEGHHKSACRHTRVGFIPWLLTRFETAKIKIREKMAKFQVAYVSFRKHWCAYLACKCHHRLPRNTSTSINGIVIHAKENGRFNTGHLSSYLLFGVDGLAYQRINAAEHVFFIEEFKQPSRDTMSYTYAPVVTISYVMIDAV